MFVPWVVLKLRHPSLDIFTPRSERKRRRLAEENDQVGGATALRDYGWPLKTSLLGLSRLSHISPGRRIQWCSKLLRAPFYTYAWRRRGVWGHRYQISGGSSRAYYSQGERRRGRRLGMVLGTDTGGEGKFQRKGIGRGKNRGGGRKILVFVGWMVHAHPIKFPFRLMLGEPIPILAISSNLIL